jgi:hypothetical protein
MFKAVAVALGLVAAAGIATTVHASPITDVVNPADTYIEAGTTPSPCPAGFECGAGWLRFTHDITDGGFAPGDTITGATLAIQLTEWWTTGVNHETYAYDFASQTVSCLHGNCVPNSGVLDNIVLNAGSLTDLATDGILRITISSLSGGFYFAQSVLTAEISPREEVAALRSVPVPATLVLLGAGLAALGASRARTRARSV